MNYDYYLSVNCSPLVQSAMRAITFLSLVTLSSCTSFNSAPPLAKRVDSIESTVSAVTNKEEKAAIDMANSQLWFPAIAGHFYGTPTIELKWKPELNDLKFVISSDDLLNELEKHARPFDGRETSILIAPENTRIARVVPYVLAQFDGEPVGKSEWQHPEKKRGLLLSYFDRPCRIIGSLFYEGAEVRFDIEIPSSGLYWLERRTGWFSPAKYVNGAVTRQTVLAVAYP